MTKDIRLFQFQPIDSFAYFSMGICIFFANRSDLFSSDLYAVSITVIMAAFSMLLAEKIGQIHQETQLNSEDIFSIIKNTFNTPMEENPAKIYVYNTTEGKKFIKLDDIVYLKANQTYCDFITKDRKINLTRSLHSHLSKLSEDRFLRIHRSYAINLSHVNGYSKKQVILSKNIILPLNESGFLQLEEHFNLYFLNGSNDNMVFVKYGW